MCIPLPDSSFTCECPTSCPWLADVGSVCGSNGETYESNCAFQIDACARNLDIFIKRTGECGKIISSFFFVKKCVMVAGLILAWGVGNIFLSL